jgi:RNA polymerase sigma-70 factor (ECF subfamily)
MMNTTTCLPLRTDPTDSDRRLIEAALQGKAWGYEELVNRYKDRLFTAIRSDVGCAAMAEDIVQDAFVRAVMNLDSFRYQSHFYTWLYRIAINSRRSYLRNRQRFHQVNADNDAHLLDRDDRRDTPPDQLQRAEAREQVSQALARLESHHRTILILREFDGLDYESIAEVLSVHKGTVRSRLSRARARLKHELAAYHGN